MIRFITLLCLCLTTLTADATLIQMKKEARTALVVVNSDYDETPLKSALQNGRSMRDFLKKQGFTLIYAENVDKRGFVKLIREFSKSMKTNGISLFYYNGHAVQLKKENFLIPIESAIETDKHLLRQSIALKTVTAIMQKAKSRLAVVILDAAYPKPFGTIYKPGRKGLAPLKAEKRTHYTLSRQPGTVGTSTGFSNSFVRYFSQNAVDLKSGIKEMKTFSSGNETPWMIDKSNERFYFVLPKSLPKQE